MDSIKMPKLDVTELEVLVREDIEKCLQEVMAFCDRIAVLSAGRMAATFLRGEWTDEAILAAALSGYRTEKSP